MAHFAKTFAFFAVKGIKRKGRKEYARDIKSISTERYSPNGLIRTLVLSSWVDRYIATGVGLWLIILAGFGTAILSIIFKWKFK